jgi:hypothetical protein
MLLRVTVPAASSRRFTDGISIGVLTRLVDRDLVDEVLAETGRREKRSRLLPARVVVYYVLALCLFCGDGYEEVMRKLVNGLRFLRTWRGDWRVPTTGAISQARQRLGEEPLRVLFERVAVPIAVAGTRGAWFHGWRVMAVDGVMLDVPDTPENDAAFGRMSHKGRPDPFPQVRIVGLGECGTHAIVAAACDSWRVYERELFERVLGEGLEPGMLVLADRGFYSYEMWCKAVDAGAELVWRVKGGVELPVVEWLADGSYRSYLLPAQVKAAFKQGRSLRRAEALRREVRVVQYRVTNRSGTEEIIRLVTSIVDHELAPAAELAALYAQRWEFELMLDEVETHQMPASRVLRSKTPELVRQEIWALLLTHYAVREFMHEAAESADVDDGLDVDELSFVRSLNAVRRQVTNQAGFSPSPLDDGDHGDA